MDVLIIYTDPMEHIEGTSTFPSRNFKMEVSAVDTIIRNVVRKVKAASP